jgi:hypothetical protein
MSRRSENDMNDPFKQRQPLVGPPSWANWRAMCEGAPTSGAVEVPLYSDAWTIGEVTTGLGPYQFFNTVAVHHGHGIVRTAVVVRLELHMEFDNQDPDKMDPGVYHGGGLVDELAALASLLTGARFRAGGQSRRFEPTDGPRGRPIAWDPRPEPTLPVGLYGIVLPTCGGAHSLMPLEQLTIYPAIDARDAISVVRAARLYQNALWVAESEPNLAWIMLVSAVEAAANRWQTSKDEPLLRLRSANPDLVEYLDSTNIEGLAERIAAEFADAIGSTRKFVEFLMAHLPPPPPTRPVEQGQIAWDDTEMRRAFRVIYGHRSRALHDGIPFPAPLCRPVAHIRANGVVSERPLFIRASEMGGTWLAKDVPMFLHIFEYIARHAIATWWQALPAA